MALYTPEHFGGDEPAALQIIQDYPFATLVTSLDGQEPQFTYLPMFMEEGALWGHVAKPNPHWRRFAQGRTYALFQGPHAFVSPGWYAKPSGNVPTWNYAAVHVHGQPEILNEAGARHVVKQLTARFDQGKQFTDPEKVESLLKGIVAFRIPIIWAKSKFKMSQNKSEADRAGVIAGLRATGRPEDRAVADWMEKHGAKQN